MYVFCRTVAVIIDYFSQRYSNEEALYIYIYIYIYVCVCVCVCV